MFSVLFFSVFANHDLDCSYCWPDSSNLVKGIVSCVIGIGYDDWMSLLLY